MFSIVLLDLILLGLIFRDCLANLILVWLLGCLRFCLGEANLRGESRRGRLLFPFPPVKPERERIGEGATVTCSAMLGVLLATLSYYRMLLPSELAIHVGVLGAHGVLLPGLSAT